MIHTDKKNRIRIMNSKLALFVQTFFLDSQTSFLIFREYEFWTPNFI